MDDRSSRSPSSVSANNSSEKSRRDHDSYRDGRHSGHSKSSDSRNDKDSKSRREDRSSKRSKRDQSRRRSSDRSERKSYDRQLHRERHKRSRNDEGSRRSRRSRSRSSHDNNNSRRSRRSRSHSSHSRNSHCRERDRDRERERERDRKRDSYRSRSGSYERNNHHSSYSWDQEHERNSLKDINSGTITKEELNQISLEAVREIRETRFDTSQALQGLMNNSQASKNFSALFNNSNSNDSNSNGPSENSQDGTERKKRKKSRWGGSENDKTFIPGMPTILPSTLDPTQQEAYLVQLQIEEISRKLRTGELGIPLNPEERSPSPEPVYSSDGKRLNTREFRYRKKLEEQRHNLIQKMNTVNPDFKPPADYKPPITRVIDKVLIPQEQHPDINFVGLLIGPRGNTLKAMEKETGAKIIIRGKGSVKEGKVGRKDGQPLAGEDEPLHAFITASNPEAVKRAVDKIKDIIRQGIEVPEGHNDLRRMQLRELAQLNGTLRETDCPRCTNCGSIEHKSWLCPDKPNVTNNIICIICGGVGHISKDCRSKRPGESGSETTEDVQAKIDEEYMSLMAELGEGPPTSANSQQKLNVDPLSQVHINRGYNIFDKKPINTPAIQGSSTMAGSTSSAVTVPTTIPPPTQSMAIPTGPVLPVPTPPTHTIPPNWVPPVGITPPLVLPPLVPPPGSTKVIPLLPWMNASQPPPPGGDLPPPPGTSPLSPQNVTGSRPPLVPPPLPSSVLSNIMPPWGVTAPNLMSSNFCPWMGSTPPYIAPPPPPPGIPTSGMGTLPQPPPPPPPLT